MDSVLSGGCQCGAVRYEVRGRPIRTYACHCSICQKQSGSAFGLSAQFPAGSFSLTQGRLENFVRPGRGRNIRCYFCSSCGTRVYHQMFTDEGDLPRFSLKPGTLDDRSRFRPDCHLWVENAQPWVTFWDTDVVFAQQPDPEDMPVFHEQQ
jgi:hypothetical protein